MRDILTFRDASHVTIQKYVFQGGGRGGHTGTNSLGNDRQNTLALTSSKIKEEQLHEKELHVEYDRRMKALVKVPACPCLSEY